MVKEAVTMTTQNKRAWVTKLNKTVSMVTSLHISTKRTSSWTIQTAITLRVVMTTFLSVVVGRIVWNVNGRRLELRGGLFATWWAFVFYFWHICLFSSLWAHWQSSFYLVTRFIFQLKFPMNSHFSTVSIYEPWFTKFTLIFLQKEEEEEEDVKVITTRTVNTGTVGRKRVVRELPSLW